MLSRHAESLFWIGRYIERAEDTARMLDVTYHNVLESPPTESTRVWQELLEVLYLDGTLEAGRLTAADVSRFLVADRSNPGSIAAAVGYARENARGVRDRISTELWETINRFHLDLAEMDLGARLDVHPYEVFRFARERCQMISGVASQTMARDDGYRFILLGLMLERAEMACRLLAVRYARLLRAGGPMAFHSWLAVLKSLSAYEAYIKEHRAAFDATRVLEFLMLSPEFPRSVLYSLQVAEAQLQELVGEGPQPEVVRLMGRVRAETEFCDIGEVLASGLDQYLEALQEKIYRVAAAVDRHFFRAGTDLDLHSYEAI
jgi:uncharacterized alpha-E superfamily protein